MINEFHEQIDFLDLRGQSNSNTAIFKGVLNLMVLQEPLDWQTGRVPNAAEIQSHHIVPKTWLSHVEADASALLDSVINRTLITSETSRVFVRDRMPNEYLEELLEENDRADLLHILETHCISQEALEVLLRDPFSVEDFEAFLTIRSQTIKEHLRNLLDSYPDTREETSSVKNVELLDRRIEQVELSLRNLIFEKLKGKYDLLPNHTKVALEPRLLGEEKRNPSVTKAQLKSLDFALCFADLRDIERIIKSKQQWLYFERIFRNKQELANQFTQVINLRNAKRHSRPIDAYTRAAGEAGTIWFEKVLKLDANV